MMAAHVGPFYQNKSHFYKNQLSQFFTWQIIKCLKLLTTELLVILVLFYILQLKTVEIKINTTASDSSKHCVKNSPDQQVWKINVHVRNNKYIS